MEPRFLEGSNIDQVDLRVINVEGDLHQHSVQVEGRSECAELNHATVHNLSFTMLIASI
jgi:hypothetical protein